MKALLNLKEATLELFGTVSPKCQVKTRKLIELGHIAGWRLDRTYQIPRAEIIKLKGDEDV